MDDLLLEALIGPDSITEADGAFRFEGAAVFENALSGNGRFYPASFIDESIKRTLDWQSKGHVTTIHSSHASAFEGRLPVGKATVLEHTDGALRFKGQISKTTEGADIVRLVKDNVISLVSIRSSQFDYTTEKMETPEGKEPVDVMHWAVIEGIDFCERPGITGAGITRILESAPTWAQKENDMEWSEITLESLRENRGDLLEGYLTEHLGAFLSERDGLKEALAAKDTELAEHAAKIAEMDRTEEINSLNEKISALTAAQEAAEWLVKRFESVAPQWLAEVVEALAECDPTELETRAVELREEAIARYTTSVEPQGKGLVSESDPNIPIGDGLVSEEVFRNTR